MMKYVKKFVGEKVYFSSMSIDDAEQYVEWLADRSISDNLGNTVNLLSIEQERDWIINAGAKGDVNFAIIDKETDELIGNCSLMKIDRIHRHAIIGIFIGDESKRGHGYGTDALKLLLKYAFSFQNMHSLHLEVFSFNQRAIQCYEKLGFQKVGTLHEAYFLDGKYYDIIFMEILENNYQNNL